MFSLRRVLRAMVGVNCRISAILERLAARLVDRTSGMADFSHRVAPSLLRPGMRLLDVGGGRNPSFDDATVRKFGLHVTGLDISEDELRLAPPGAYHGMLVGDVATAAIRGPYDLILSRAVLEHVENPAAALDNMGAALAEGGIMAHFIPCRNAPFAMLNRALGNRLVRRIMVRIYPQSLGMAGFKAYYRFCVPSQVAAWCQARGMEIVELKPYFVSDYFRFFAPAHAIELVRQMLTMLLGVRDLAETFCVVARKKSQTDELREL